jgi:hypothetical protein
MQIAEARYEKHAGQRGSVESTAGPERLVRQNLADHVQRQHRDRAEQQKEIQVDEGRRRLARDGPASRRIGHDEDQHHGPDNAAA